MMNRMTLRKTKRNDVYKCNLNANMCHINMSKSSLRSKLNVDFDSAGDCDVGHFLDLRSRAFKVNVSFEDSHLEIIPCLRTLTARGSSTHNSEVLVGESDRSSDFDA